LKIGEVSVGKLRGRAGEKDREREREREREMRAVKNFTTQRRI